MPIKPLFIYCCALLVFASTGCARVTTLSVVHKDGSFLRTVTYRVNEPESSSGTNTGAPGTQKFEDLANLPKGPEWKVTRSKEDSTTVVTAARTVAASGTTIANDLGLKAGDSAGAAGSAAPLIDTKVTVSRTADNHIEYREVLHWNGKLDDQLTKPNPKVVAGILETLPASVRGDTKAVDALAVTMQASFWETLFGAPKALFSEFLMNQDYASYELGRRLAPAFDKALSDQFGSRLTSSERAAAITKMLSTIMASASDKTKPESAQSNSGLNLTSLFYRVQLPGKVVSSNGEVDDYSNEVVWSLYSLGPAAKDVVLSATCEVK